MTRSFSLVLALSFCTALASGCAELSPEQCRSSDWYQVGQSEGRMDARGQGERHAANCGTAFNADRYRDGFQEGWSHRPPPGW